jgi:hypothetical protein
VAVRLAKCLRWQLLLRRRDQRPDKRELQKCSRQPELRDFHAPSRIPSHSRERNTPGFHKNVVLRRLFGEDYRLF